MTDDERAYFRQRAEEEIEAARAADHPDAARAHYMLAGYYLDFAFNPIASVTPTAPRPGREGADAAPVTAGAAFA